MNYERTNIISGSELEVAAGESNVRADNGCQ